MEEKNYLIVQEYLFPSEQKEDLISQRYNEDHSKLCLYRTNSATPKGLTFVTWNIKPEECTYSKYQFYLFRPLMNVFLPIYIVFPDELEKRHSKAIFQIIYPVKKKVLILKNYLKDKVQKYTEGKEAFKFNPIMGFKLQFIADSRELVDDEYVESWMNDKEIFLIASDKNNISQNFSALVRFYYTSYDQSTRMLSNEPDSLDYDERTGLKLDVAKKKLIEKHQNGKNFPDDKVIILFNGVIQTSTSERLDDLFSDNHFYQFVVIFESSDMIIQNKRSTFENRGKRKDLIHIGVDERPLIVNFEIAGEPKEVLNIHLGDLNDETISANSNENSNDNIDESNENVSYNTSSTTEIPQADININDNQSNQEEQSNNNSNSEIITNDDQNEFYFDDSIDDGEDGNDAECPDQEKLLDMFCFYFEEFSKDKNLDSSQTPNASYFRNLSKDETSLLSTFKKYFKLYLRENH